MKTRKEDLPFLIIRVSEAIVTEKRVLDSPTVSGEMMPDTKSPTWKESGSMMELCTGSGIHGKCRLKSGPFACVSLQDDRSVSFDSFASVLFLPSQFPFLQNFPFDLRIHPVSLCKKETPKLE